jgi:hypothetical protein
MRRSGNGGLLASVGEHFACSIMRITRSLLVAASRNVALPDLNEAWEIAHGIDGKERLRSEADRDFVEGGRWSDDHNVYAHVLDLSERQARRALMLYAKAAWR